MLFDLSIIKILVLGVLALVIFGPERLPALAAQAGRALRDLRRLADNAKSELSDGLGPEFANFDLADLNPKAFVRKHLLEELNDGASVDGAAAAPSGAPAEAGVAARLQAGEMPPFDAEAT